MVFIRCYQANCLTLGTITGRAANSVNVIFILHRQIKIYDVLDMRNVYTSSSHICCAQNSCVSTFKARYCFVSLPLTTTTMNQINIETIL